MIGLLMLGKSDFDNVNEFHTDEEFYKPSLGIAYDIISSGHNPHPSHIFITIQAK